MSEDDCRIILRIVKAWYNRRTADISWSMPDLPLNGGPSSNINRLIQSIAGFEREYQELMAERKVEEILDAEQEIDNGESFGFAVLTDEDKAAVRERLVHIRELISSSRLAERKKAALLKRVADLELEIETVGTRTDRFFSFLGDAAFVVGEMAEKAKPFTDEVKEMMKIIYLRREDTERVRLPRGEDDLLLPPPNG